MTKESAFKQIRALKYRGVDVVLNLCDGAVSEGKSGPEVIQYLDFHKLAYTGCDKRVYMMTKF